MTSKHHFFLSTLILGGLCCVVVSTQAQDGSTGGAELSAPALIDGPEFADVDNPLLFNGRVLACGGLATAGTPIAGNAAGGGNSGDITISGIPATASILSARLYWSVLTNSDAAAEVGKSISFDGNPVSGEMIGFSNSTPCFAQDNTVAWSSDVTSLLTDPGNGTYAVSGFPGDNIFDDADFTEGVSLVIAWSDDGAEANTLVAYDGLAVSTPATMTISIQQSLGGFVASGAPGATLVPVVGNGQVTGGGEELFGFLGSGGLVDFSGTLDGSTSAFAAETCSYQGSGLTACYWDDDVHDVSAALDPGDTSGLVGYELQGDCHSMLAMELAVPVDDVGACAIGGEMVDAACPPGGDYANHGDYVSCVAAAKEAALSNLGCLDEATLAEISSCIVNPRARSNVGKPGS